jgi:hypothetical protein
MPTYKVTSPDGRTVNLTGDSPPTEGELMQIFGTLGANKEAPIETPKPSFAQKIRSQIGVDRMLSPQAGELSSKDLAPMLMSALGGVGGTISPIPGGGAIGGTLGYAAGKNFNRAIGLDQQVSLPETARRTVMQDLPEGALAEVTGNVASRGIARASDALTKRTVTPEMQQRIKMYDKAEVPYTAADITQHKGMGLVEGNIRRNPASATKANKFDVEKLQAIQDEAARVETKFGGKTASPEAGELSQEAISKRYKVFMNTADKLYKAVPVDPTLPIETPKLRDVAIGHLDELGKMGTGVKKVLTIAENSVVPSAGGLNQQLPNYTWEQLNADKSTLRKMAESTGDYNKKRILYDLVSAINDDIAQFSNKFGNGEIKTALDTANKFYRKGNDLVPGAEVFRSRQIMNAVKNDSPEKIVTTFIKPNNSSNIGLLVKAAGSEGVQPIKAAWVSRMFEKGEGQSFSPLKFASEFDTYKPADLNAFLSKEEISGLKDLARLSRASSQVEKMAGNPSGTAQQGMTTGTIWSAMYHPVLTAVEMIGANRFAELYFNNPSFRNTLIAGTKMRPESKSAISLAAKLSAIAGMNTTTPQEQP